MRILFLQKRILFPADVGGKIRTLNVVRHLARWHEVTYLCNVQPGEEGHLAAMRDLGVRLVTIPWRETPRRSPKFFAQLALNLCSRYPFNVNKDYDPRLRKAAIDLLAAEPYDLVVCDFVQMARNAIGLDAPAAVLFQHNVEAEIFLRHARNGEGFFKRRYMALQWRKMRRFEAEAGRCFDAVVAVSARDRDSFQRDYGWRHVEIIDTAVDTDYFRPQDVPLQPDRVVFVGSLDWLPNEDGLLYFAERVWPRVRQQRPAASLQIVGRNPPRSVQNLSRIDGIQVVGTVPDVRPYLAAASAVVVPLRIGGGTRLKIFEAMAMRKAIVSTTLGAEGLDVAHEQHLLLADGEQQFADAVLRLLRDDAARDAIAQRACRLVREAYAAEAVARQFEHICRRAVDAARRPGRATGMTAGVRASV